jgi:hypothetical protein
MNGNDKRDEKNTEPNQYQYISTKEGGETKAERVMKEMSFKFLRNCGADRDCKRISYKHRQEVQREEYSRKHVQCT